MKDFPIHDGSGDESDLLNEHVHDPGDPDGVVAAEIEKHWQERHPAPPTTPRGVYQPKRRWLKVILTVLIIAAATVGAYWFGSHQAAAPKTKTTQHQTTTPQQKASAQTTTSATQHYTSATYSLGFDYPTTWTVSDTAAKLTVSSPGMQLQTAVGTKTNARVVVTIQKQQTSVPGFPPGGAVAPLGSQKLTYKQPSPVQRAQTYLSYLSYTVPNGLDALYVTGDYGYQAGQQIPMSDIVHGDPLISVTFDSCADTSCTTSSPVTLQASKWLQSSASKDVINLIESLVVTG